MLDRVALGALPDKPHTVFRAPADGPLAGALLQEEMFTRGGFDGPFSYLYHQRPITAAVEVVATEGFPVAVAHPEGNHPLRRRLYQAPRAARRGPMLRARTSVVVNHDVAMYVLRPDQDDEVLFANGDGDELFYVFSGELELESMFGRLRCRPGDYVHVPRSTIHRWRLLGKEAELIVFECRGGCVVPGNFRNPVGQLKLDAPYTHRDFVRPTAPIATLDAVADGPRDVVVKKGDRFTLHRLSHTPLDVVGWDGFAYPFVFPIEKYQPKTGLVHLPPTIHTTFTGPGFAICSFVPRVTDTHPEAIPCPYPHSSVDCDEILFYVRGNFTSRKGVGPGAISLHPAGIPHGPHPGAYERSIGSTRTDELAVMIDTFLPLLPTTDAVGLEDPAYHDSWKL